MNTIAFIDLERIRRNVKEIKLRTGKRLLLMVKADAYGLGILPVSRALEAVVDMLGVVDLDEGVYLRENGITAPVLVACVKPEELIGAREYSLTVAVNSLAELDKYAALPRNLRPSAHLKLNTGMNRFGISEKELDRAIELIRSSEINFDGCYTHLRSPVSGQQAAFDRACARLSGTCSLGTRHVCASSALHETANYNMVRVGLSAYDGAMTVVSEVLAARKLKAGEYLGYGDKRIEKDCVAAWIFGGYADGIDREHPQRAIIRGEFCSPLAVCMDTFAVETPFLPEVGELVTIQNDQLTAAGIAEDADSVPYTVLTGRRGRIKRIYYDQSGSEDNCKS